LAQNLLYFGDHPLDGVAIGHISLNRQRSTAKRFDLFANRCGQPLGLVA